MYQVAATLDLFNKQLTLDEVLHTELPMLSDLFDARSRFLDDKRKIEKQEADKMRDQQKNNK